MDAYIVAAVRTPVGRRNGGLSQAHPADLAGVVLSELVRRAGVDPADVDDVYLGCVDQMGPQSGNIARMAWLTAGLPESVPGVTLDRQCGSSQQAVHFAAQAVMSGQADLVVAGGVETMSSVPLQSPVSIGEGLGMPAPWAGTGWLERYGDQEISQFRGAELIAEKWAITRAEMEAFALESHRRALAAQDAGAFDAEIVTAFGVGADEGPRRDSTAERLAGLATLRPGGRITAAAASQISDGAAALLVASEDAVRRHAITPLARVHAMSAVGSDPVLMLTGPIPATEGVLAKGRLELSDIDAFEVNEAFASVVLAWQRETGADLARTNVNGGAIALGHPLGATGARLMTSLVHHLHRTGGRYGLQTMCEGGGMANATIIERV
jgi:acetyl-CoA C-acetyltransferase